MDSKVYIQLYYSDSEEKGKKNFINGQKKGSAGGELRRPEGDFA